MSVVSAPKTRSLPALPWRSLLAAMLRPADHGWYCILILTVFCFLMFFYGLNTAQFWRTEGLRAIIAEEFLRSGNWIVPRLYGEALFTKPPGMYAAIALCSLPFGAVTEFSARLPSALAATATVFLFYWYAGRQLGRLGGLVTALIMPLSLLWLEKATAAEIDMLHLFWTAAAILFFLRALDAAKPHLPMTFVLLSFLCMAGGTLTKFTTPVFFYLTIIPLLWQRGQLRLLKSWRHWLGVALAASLCFAWVASAVALEGWAMFASTIEREAMQRISPAYTPKPYPWLESLFHPAKLLLVTLPFSPLALVTLRSKFSRLWDNKGQRWLTALHCWTWPNMLFWCIPNEHTPRHSFPLFPGIAGLAAMVMLAFMTGKMKWRVPMIRPQHLLIVVLILWLGLKLAFTNIVMTQRSANGQPREKGALLASLVPVQDILYIFRLKDEGVMFYYGRKVLRLSGPEQLPITNDPVYCVLVPEEMEGWSHGSLEIVQRMTDAQRDPIFLVRVTRDN